MIITPPTITPHELEQVRDRASLFAFLGSTLGWPVSAEDTFTYDEPLLNGTLPTVQVSRLLPFGAGDPFLILLAEWETPLKRAELREILSKVRARIRTAGAYGINRLEEIVFVCPAQDYHGVWLAHFEEREGRQPRLEVFGWDAERTEATRTLREVNLPALAMPGRNVLDEPDWAEGRPRWLAAWDVEAVTRSFFKDYREVFGGVRDSLPEEFTGDRTLWTQRLFNRLLFIHFLSQKREGWLRFGGRRDYLHALWDGRDPSANFYSAHLRPLFFTALNNRHVRSLREDNPTLHKLIGDVPYLNGGLFEKAADDDAITALPEAALERVLALFGRYRFTITESTPDDVEVAVDPEMLGKVFEELVTGRHESGSYYTPRPVVSFMCREALKGCLGGHAELVDGRQADSLTRKEAAALLARLAALRVVDPACGSGAYLLGMLHELYALTGLLELRADPLSPGDQYKRKLGIIQNALYGVDLDPFAVNVARLRLWLSLAVEHTGAVPEPLPNLDFKVEAGDSLAVPLPQRNLTGDLFRQAQLADYLAAKREYGSPYCTGDRKALKERIDALKVELTAWAHPGADPKKAVPGFDWQVEFAEVFASSDTVADLGGAMNFGGTLAEPPAPGGFDIVLANPPYVRMELFKEQKPTLKHNFPEVHSERADLYCYFYARAVQLLKPGGMLAFISPNKWYRAAYGARLREYIANTCKVVSIVDFGDLPVFQAASAYPTIFVAQKSGVADRTTFTLVETLSPPYPKIAELVRGNGQLLPIDAIKGQNWRFSISPLPKINGEATTLGELIQGQIFRGIVTGLNAAFCIDASMRDEMILQSPNSKTVIKHLIIGEDIRRWRITDKARWLLYMRHGIDVADLEALIAHLKPFRAELENRATKQAWYELQQPQAKFAPFFEEVKIVYPQIMIQPRFTLDKEGSYINQKCFIIRSNDLYLLGLLNSSTVWKIIVEGSPMLRGGYVEPRRDLMLSLPIPLASEADKSAIAALVQNCLDAGGVDCGVWEAEIDARVAALYGL